MNSAGKTNRSTEDNDLIELAVICTAGMLLVAFANGNLGQNGRDTIIEFAKVTRRQVPAEQILKTLDEMTNDLTQMPEHHRRGLFVGAQRFSRKDKHLILGMCLKTAVADDNYSTDAKILIRKIAAWLGMNEHDFEIWQEESVPLRQAPE